MSFAYPGRSSVRRANSGLPGAKWCVLGLVASVVALSGTACPDPNPPVNDCSNTGVLINIRAEDHIEGDANAPVTIVLYSDFQCPFCGTLARQVLPEIRTTYINTVKVRLIFRHFRAVSAQTHPDAVNAARAAECAADQDKFYEYHDELFADDSHRTMLATANLKQYAVNVGLNSTLFDTCVDGGGKAARVQSDFDSAAALGLTGTPSYFVGVTGTDKWIKPPSALRTTTTQVHWAGTPTKEQIFAGIEAALTCAGQ